MPSRKFTIFLAAFFISEQLSSRSSCQQRPPTVWLTLGIHFSAHRNKKVLQGIKGAENTLWVFLLDLDLPKCFFSAFLYHTICSQCNFRKPATGHSSQMDSWRLTTNPSVSWTLRDLVSFVVVWAKNYKLSQQVGWASWITKTPDSQFHPRTETLNWGNDLSLEPLCVGCRRVMLSSECVVSLPLTLPNVRRLYISLSLEDIHFGCREKTVLVPLAYDLLTTIFCSLPNFPALFNALWFLDLLYRLMHTLVFARLAGSCLLLMDPIQRWCSLITPGPTACLD